MAKARSSAKQSRAQAPAQQQNGAHALSSKLARYLDPEATWDKDQLLDAVHWIRQAVGLFCGLLWGAVPLVGAVWIALFMAISTGIIYWYYAYVLKIDEEEYGGHGALLQEGLFASFTLFLLSWTLVYSLAHF
ncbi:respirasome Complex Assembly Factor 1-like [Panicum virgatum]|uniref:respirasome Complex Assembly Factor 1-like n=1 Tax=Panicum virgatum TaxID=38727 RepID=UPI0002A996F5|nr:respirasome Complex Assembly Factor 1-like [Panicum virgatum]